MFGAGASHLVGLLFDAGIRATTDPRNAHPPCALVVPDTAEPITGCAYEVTYLVDLVAPGIANLDALAVLDDLLTKAAPVLHYPSARLAAWVSPQTGETLLSWRLTVDQRIDIEPEV